MQEIHLTNIKYIELNTISDLNFSYKPDVPKIKVVGNAFLAEDEEEDDMECILFLTQKQLNQVLNNKEIELKLNEEEKWTVARPLTKEQIKKIGLVNLESEFLGNAEDVKCFEVIKVTE